MFPILILTQIEFKKIIYYIKVFFYDWIKNY